MVWSQQPCKQAELQNLSLREYLFCSQITSAALSCAMSLSNGKYTACHPHTAPAPTASTPAAPDGHLLLATAHTEGPQGHLCCSTALGAAVGFLNQKAQIFPLFSTRRALPSWSSSLYVHHLVA